MKKKELTASKYNDETLPKSEHEKCCGNCLYCKKTEDQELLCTMHKLQTKYLNLCYAWEGKTKN